MRASQQVVVCRPPERPHASPIRSRAPSQSGVEAQSSLKSLDIVSRKELAYFDIP